MERPRPPERLQAWTELLTRLDGRPVWVLDLIEYVTAVLQRRDRINIYDAARQLSPMTHGRGHIGAADIRVELQELCGPSRIEWTGRFQHRAFLSEHAHRFWCEIVLPAFRRPEPWDLGMAVALLSQRDIRSIWGDRVLSPYLPPRARSASKLSCISHVVRGIHRSPEEHDRFRRGQLATESGLREWSELLADEPWVQLREVGAKGTTALVRLMDLVLARPLIEADGSELRVRFANIVQFEKAKTAKPVAAAPRPLSACVEQAVAATAERFGELQHHRSLRRQSLVERQLALLGEREKDAAGVLEFVAWLGEAAPGGAMKKRLLPEDGRCELWQGSEPGQYAPYVFPDCSALHLVGIAERYGLVTMKEAEGIISLSELADIAAGRHPPPDLAKLTWGRNVDKLTVTPVGGLPDTALDVLRRVAQEVVSGEFLVTPDDLATRSLDEHQLCFALGSFARLSSKNVKRLRGWASVSPDVPVFASVAIKKTDVPPGVDLATLAREHSTVVEETSSYFVLVGLQPAEVRQWLAQPGSRG